MNLQRLLQKIRVPAAELEPLPFNQRAMEGMVDSGVMHPRALQDLEIGDPMAGSDNRMYMPQKPTELPEDYLSARLGSDEAGHGRGIALHEQSHLVDKGGFWDERPTMMAWRAQNRGLPEGMLDDLLRTARSYSLDNSRNKFTELATDLENSLAISPAINYDYQGREILADSGARLGKFLQDSPRGQGTFDFPFLQELSVASTAADRPLAAIESVKRFARRRPPIDPTTFEQGTLEY